MEMTKSEQIRAGLQKSFQSGTSAKASTVCYGYKISRAGELVIDPAEADTVLFIFHHFMNGDSLGNITRQSSLMNSLMPCNGRKAKGAGADWLVDKLLWAEICGYCQGDSSSKERIDFKEGSRLLPSQYERSRSVGQSGRTGTIL